MLSRIRDLRDAHLSFAFETTLATRSYVSFLRHAKADGYIIHLSYIWLSSALLARNRVALRVRRGGHHVPDKVVERRYHRGIRNLFRLYMPLADSWVIFDNSGEQLITVANAEADRDPAVLEARILAKIKCEANHEPD